MELNELLQKLLEAEVAKAAPKAPEAPEAPAAAPAAASLDAEALTKLIEAAVAKAMPARPEGAGSRAESLPTAEVGEKKPSPDAAMAQLVAKAAKPEELTQAEKRAIWSVTYAALRAGLQEDPRER